MKTVSGPWLVCIGLLWAQALAAQDTPGDIRPLLRGLTQVQKLKMLDYLRHLGADLDQELQDAYEQVEPAQQTKAVQYLSALRNEGARPARTTVEWSRDTIFFGAIESGRIVFDSVTVQNTGQAPYVITDIVTACDCAVLARPEFAILPGESATLRIRFDSKGRVGPMLAGIVIYDNSIPNARNILYLAGEVLPRRGSGGNR